VPALAIHPGPPPGFGSPVLELNVPSRVDQVPALVARLLDAALAQRLIAPHERDWFSLCADEALVNAMVHGNEADPQLPIRIQLAADASSWRLAIQDAGSGFSLKEVPDADAPGASSREHGRGIRLMCTWLDRLTYYQQGAVALLERHTSGGGPAGASDVAAGSAG
jgi:serine/threonine-protein kinase RsbW